MSNNGKRYSTFSILGLCLSLVTPFMFSGGYLAYVGIVMPFITLTLSIVGIIDAHKNKKNGALLSVLGIIISLLLILCVVTVASFLINSRLHE